LIRKFGGSEGVRAEELLLSAIHRPFQTFGGEDLYPDAVSIGESIIKNHPFVDGNKRTGYALMRLLILESNQDLAASEDETYDFVISISKGELDVDQIKAWLSSKLMDQGS
jgi:death on curing protein